MNIKVYEELCVDDPRRFYPHYVPVITFEPLRTHFAILESPEEIRKGVISLSTFEEGSLIAQLTGTVLSFQTLHTLQYSKSLYFEDVFFSGYLLHSCNPNAKFDMSNFSLHAIKKIRPFEKITVDYEATEDVLYNKFECDCGYEKCRKIIEGKLRARFEE